METPHALLEHIHHFFSLVAARQIEIYNEFSLQHELGIHLRDRLRADGTKVRFERPVSFFSLPGKFEKKEIDLSLTDASGGCSVAIELKFPRAGQYPEQMFKACQDILFLEQLVSAGFAGGFFIMAAEHPLFYRREDATGIYRFFREGTPIAGQILYCCLYILDAVTRLLSVTSVLLLLTCLRATVTVGISTPDRMAMMAMTVSSSMRVKPTWKRRRGV